jgi:hypothetical protein
MHPLPRSSTRTHAIRSKRLAALLAVLLSAVAAARPAAAQQEAGPSTVPISGQVVDRSTGQPLAGAFVEVAGTHLETLTDAQGRFTFRKLRPGEHTVAVSLLGYADLEQKLTAAAGQPEVALAMEPDPVLLEGLTVNLDVLEQRRNRIAVASRAFDRAEIRRSAAVNMEAFVRGRGGVQAVVCRRAFADACVYSRGRYEPVAVYLDEVPIHSLDHLTAVQPAEVERVEVYQNGRQVRVYTSWFMEQVARGKRWVNPVFIR